MQRDPFDDLKRFAQHLENEVSPARAEIRARQAINAARMTRRPRRAVVAVATAVLMGIGNTALAAVADPAIPGDALYGVDRAYENIGTFLGLGGLHVGERFDEAGELVALGRAAEALELVQEALAKVLESDDPQAAVEELIASGNPDAAGRVASLLEVARAVDVDGQAVAAAARALVENVELPEQARGNPGGTPDKPDTPADTRPNQDGNPGASGDNPGRGNQQP